MSNAVYFNTYKLNEGSFVPDFKLAVENLFSGYISKQPGFVSSMLLLDGDLWADCTVFETTEDAKKFANAGGSNDLANKFYSYLDFGTCQSNLFSVKQKNTAQSVAPSIVTVVTFKLRKGTSLEDFALASEKLYGDIHTLDDVYISSMQLLDGDLWADLLLWKSMEGPNKAASAEREKTSPAVNEYLSFIGAVPFHHHFAVEKCF